MSLDMTIPASARQVSLEGRLAATKPTSVAVSTLVSSEAMQPRQRVSNDVIQRYRALFKNNGKPPFPPIVVARLTDQLEERGCLFVIDGFHRVAAARAAGVKKIAARVIEATKTEAEWYAVKANSAHGLPLSKSDHVEAFDRYMRAGQNVAADGSLMSYREIAADLGGIRSHQTFANWMSERFPVVAAAMANREPEQISRNDDMHDNAQFLETRLRDYAEGARRTAKAMLRAQREAVERSPRNAGRSPAEKDQRAALLTRKALLEALEEVLAGAEEATGMNPVAMLAEVERMREASAGMDF